MVTPFLVPSSRSLTRFQLTAPQLSESEQDRASWIWSCHLDSWWFQALRETL